MPNHVCGCGVITILDGKADLWILFKERFSICNKLSIGNSNDTHTHVGTLTIRLQQYT